jgi:EmrB/QacA subfamily drug resistance transporter
MTAADGGRLDPALVRLAAVLLVGGITPFLDTTIVNVAIAAIGHGLHAPVSAVQWVLTGYLLSFAMVVPLSGWALARFGGRATWMFSLAVFLAGSALCGAAWNIGSLVAFRVVQGIGGGMMVPIMMTLLVQAAGGRNLGRLMSTVSLPVIVVPVLGPVVGGLIVSSLTWRWIFYVNVPVGLAGLILAWFTMRPDTAAPARRAAAGRLDITGLLLLSPGLAAILYGLAQVGQHGGFGSLAVLGPAGAGLAATGLFVVHALRLGRAAGPGETAAGAARRVVPVLDLGLLRSRSFTGSAILMFVFGLSLYGAMLLLPLYYQEVRGASALSAGLLLAPQGLGTLLPRLVIGRLTDRLGPRPVVLAGTVIAMLGTVPFALAGARTSEIWLSLALVVRGAGLGAATIAVMAAAYHGLSRAQVPHASSATRITQQVGGAFGASLLAVLLERAAASHATAGLAGLAAAFGATFWWCVGLTLLALAPALLLAGRRRLPSEGFEGLPDSFGMADRNDPGRAQRRRENAGEVPGLVVAVEPGRPDLRRRDRVDVHVDDERGAHPRRREHADIAVAHVSPGAPAVGHRVVQR